MCRLCKGGCLGCSEVCLEVFRGGVEGGARSTSANFRLASSFLLSLANFDFGQFLDVDFWDHGGWKPRRVEAQT